MEATRNLAFREEDPEDRAAQADRQYLGCPRVPGVPGVLLTEATFLGLGGSANSLAIRPREELVDPPGMSVSKGRTLAETAAAMRRAYPNATGLRKAAECVGASCVAKIRAAGIDVIPKPSDRFPNHYRIIHTDGAAGFTPENLKRLERQFTDTVGHSRRLRLRSFWATRRLSAT